MTGLPEFFEQTSDKPYDRHAYRIEMKDGRSIVVDDYTRLRSIWFEQVRNYTGCTITVLDIKQNKKKSNGGFK
jgi:hypothetical protein